MGAPSSAASTCRLQVPQTPSVADAASSQTSSRSPPTTSHEAADATCSAAVSAPWCLRTNAAYLPNQSIWIVFPAGAFHLSPFQRNQVALSNVGIGITNDEPQGAVRPGISHLPSPRSHTPLSESAMSTQNSLISSHESLSSTSEGVRPSATSACHVCWHATPVSGSPTLAWNVYNAISVVSPKCQYCMSSSPQKYPCFWSIAWSTRTWLPPSSRRSTGHVSACFSVSFTGIVFTAGAGARTAACTGGGSGAVAGAPVVVVVGVSSTPSPRSLAHVALSTMPVSSRLLQA
mmetsp:Transcript_21878/g.70679  ORF Transcript_21878/g.70679 Transcript_21878/m.70679 type:complete len:290 (-) Transcript_21878:686-1555(-)